MNHKQITTLIERLGNANFTTPKGNTATITKTYKPEAGEDFYAANIKKNNKAYVTLGFYNLTTMLNMIESYY